MILNGTFLTEILAPVCLIVAATCGLCGRHRVAWGFVSAYAVIRFIF
jgi:hypothetical protein